MSKVKYWRVLNGQVVADGGFTVMADGVHARNKKVATFLLLNQLALRKANNPILHIENGAFNLIWHNGEEFISESGRCDRSTHPLCIGGHKTLASAIDDRAFRYYASEEYTRELALDKPATV